eukprot:scaffold5570_cov87-Skeletonema_dohrnii-CCMP3373.AAC.1
MGRRRRKNRNSQSAYLRGSRRQQYQSRNNPLSSYRPGSAMNPKDTAPQQFDQGAVSVTLPIAGRLLQSSAIPSNAAVNSRC